MGGCLSSTMGAPQVTSAALCNYELQQAARRADAEGVSKCLAAGGWTETRRPLLINRFQKVQRLDTSEDEEEGMTPLMFAAQAGSAECCRRLLAAGAIVNAVEEDGWAALHFAAHEACLDSCLVLLQSRAE